MPDWTGLDWEPRARRRMGMCVDVLLRRFLLAAGPQPRKKNSPLKGGDSAFGGAGSALEPHRRRPSSGKTMKIFRCTRQHTWCVLANALSRP